MRGNECGMLLFLHQRDLRCGETAARPFSPTPTVAFRRGQELPFHFLLSTARMIVGGFPILSATKEMKGAVGWYLCWFLQERGNRVPFKTK